MRGRLVFLTFVMMGVTLLGLTNVQAISEPTRQAARTSITTAPATIIVPERIPQTRVRNILAPLPVPAARVETAPITATGTQITPSLRLAAYVEKVTFQDVTVAYSEAEKQHIDTLISTSFAKFPARYVRQLDQLTFKKSRTGSRGMAGASVMILRTVGVRDTELVAVGIHELGHVIDMGVLKGTSAAGASAFKDGNTTVWQDDMSVEFYAISWKTDTEKRSDNPLDYVSGYALSDPFEDYSESFAMYVLHGERFRALAADNAALAKKYAYMRDRIFSGQEFAGIDAIPSNTALSVRPWDVTLEPYSWTAFERAQFGL